MQAQVNWDPIRTGEAPGNGVEALVQIDWAPFAAVRLRRILSSRPSAVPERSLRVVRF
jgi:hypothetical protein